MNNDLTPGLGFINFTSAVMFALSLFLRKMAELDGSQIYEITYKTLAFVLVCTSLIINYPKLKERITKISNKWKQPRKRHK